MTGRPSVLTLGDDVELRGVIYRLTALDGDVAMLAVAGEAPVAIQAPADCRPINAVRLAATRRAGKSAVDGSPDD
jgi:hypothetical protein